MQAELRPMTPDEGAAKLDELRYTLAAFENQVPEACFAVCDRAKERVYRPDVDVADMVALAALRVISILADDVLADAGLEDLEIRF